MPETLAALLLAHVLADFVLQTRRMAMAKAARDPVALALHVATVGLCTALALGVVTPMAALVAAAVTLAHLATDIGKSLLGPGLGAFLADQAIHLGTLVIAAALWPTAWSTGLWAAIPHLPALMALAAGVILATRAGGFAIGLLMAPWTAALAARPDPADADQPPHRAAGLPNGGQTIGLLERGLVFVMVLTGLAAGIGFLIAAKSVLRFGTVGDDRALSEYVIIGTLASFGWAILVSVGTLWLLSALPSLGIPALSP